MKLWGVDVKGQPFLFIQPSLVISEPFPIGPGVLHCTTQCLLDRLKLALLKELVCHSEIDVRVERAAIGLNKKAILCISWKVQVLKHLQPPNRDRQTGLGPPQP